MAADHSVTCDGEPRFALEWERWRKEKNVGEMSNERATEVLQFLATTKPRPGYPAIRWTENDAEACRKGAAALLAVGKLEAEKKEALDLIEAAVLRHQESVGPTVCGNFDLPVDWKHLRAAADLLVKHGRLEHNADGYRWSDTK